MFGRHLKPNSYYSDLYDRHTVEKGRRIEKSYDERDSEEYKGKSNGKEEIEKIKRVLKKFLLHMEMGERYTNKEKTIKEWMAADQKKDELYESAQAPEDIRCLTCRNRLKPTSKDLWSEQGKNDRVLFMYDCPNKCMPRRAFFNTGEEWRIKPDLCLKCDTQLELKSDDDGERLLTTKTCPKCGYVEIDEYKWTHRGEEKVDENFGKDRDRFCLTDEEGLKYGQEKLHLEQIAKFSDEWKKEEERRAEKLKQNPKGFHLEGAGYTCFICGDHTPESDNWYDEYGIKCLVCQKAIDDGEIPACLARDKESWYSNYDIQSSFNVKSPTLRKWVRQGVIKARTVSNYGKGVHTQLFLIEDNKDFLPPKEMVKSQPIITREGGKEWSSSEPWYKFVNPKEHLKGYKIVDYLKLTEEKE